MPEQDPDDVPPHMGDFYALALRIGIAMGREADIQGIFERLQGVQHQFATEEDVVIQTILDWMALSKDGQPNTARWVSPGDIFRELGELAERQGYKWIITTPSTLGAHIKELIASGAMADKFTVERVGRHGSRHDYRFSLAGQPNSDTML